jgi:hypothetical protein
LPKSPSELVDRAPHRNALIVWPRCAIYFTDSVTAPQLLHELAHCLVDERPDAMLDEVSNGMLAVEWEAQRRFRLGRQWQQWMEDYTISVGAWHHCSTVERGEALLESLLAAQERGLLDRHGRPTYRKMEVKL